MKFQSAAELAALALRPTLRALRAQMIRDVHAADFPQVLALNAASVHFLSPLDPEQLARLHGQACYHRGIDHDGALAAFLLGFADGASYDSPNYRWFAERYPRFVYVDRIVVGAALRGQGAGKLLYDDFIAFGRTRGVPVVVCEFDLEPPNPVSLAFHERFGFREIGQQVAKGKLVSLRELEL